MSIPVTNSTYLLDLTKEERDEMDTEHKHDEDNSDTIELSTTPVESRIAHKSTASPANCEYWNVARLSVDRQATKSISPIPLSTSLSNLHNPNSNVESFTNRITQFYKQNESNHLHYTDGISKHFHYILNKHHNNQSVDNSDRISLMTPSPDIANGTHTTQPHTT